MARRQEDYDDQDEVGMKILPLFLLGALVAHGEPSKLIANYDIQAALSSEAMRNVEQGGVKVDGTRVEDKAAKLAAGTYVVQVGKRKFARVTLA